MNITYRAFWVEESEPGQFKRSITQKTLTEVPDDHILVRVAYSSLNYKDALSATGNKGVTRHYPHTPGVDASGTIAESRSELFQKGDEVIVTGFDLGMNTPGAFSEYICVPASWAISRPENLPLKVSMIYGTAGLTAALCVQKMIHHDLESKKGEVLVTGATGGVGSVAVGILAKLGFDVVAVTGKTDQVEYLKQLGAKEVISRSELEAPLSKPLLKSRWAGVLDTVGGSILANAIKSTQYGGIVAACGNAASPDLPLTVFPFILRGVSLLGIDSVNCSLMDRMIIWEHLANEWALPDLEKLYTEITLEQLSPFIDKILKGEITGRVLINLN